MTDERTRWTDERLDDFAQDLKNDIGSIKSTLAQMQSDELARLRQRVADAESSADSARALREDDKEKRVGNAIAIGVPIIVAALSSFVSLILGNIIHV